MMTQLQPLAVPPTQSTVPTSTALLATVPTDAMSLHSAELGTCLLKTAVGSIAANGLCVEANILFDEGSQRSFLTKGLADSLNLHPRATETIALSTFGSQSTRTVKVDVITVYLIAISGERIPLSVLIVPTITAPLQRVATTSFTELPYLQGVHLAHPITTGDRLEITLLIGADQYWNVVEDHIIRGNGPTAMQSKLGYLLSGPTTSPVVNSDTATSILYVATAHSPDHALEKFWNVETLGTTQLDNKPTMTFMDQYLSTAITREPNGAYTACFPWKENHPPLPCNYSTCARRLQTLLRKLKATPTLLTTYSNILADQEYRGFIEKVPQPDNTANCHYIPHHAVRKDSPTTPLRIVYDCSCRQSKSLPSLNDCLLSGDPQLNDLCSIMLRFRLHKYGVCTDIEKAFLHVHLNEKDRDYTRFLWPANPSDSNCELLTYRFKVVPFGAFCSPFMLNAMLLFHLSQFTTDTSKDMLRNLYVDNIVTGCDSEKSAMMYYTMARSMMCGANFNLRSWASNSSKLMEQARQDGTATEPSFVNVLGLQWDTASDTISLTLRRPIPTHHTLVTKREVLRETSKVFDPIGILSPVTVKAKILMQKLWQLDLDWDEPLTAAVEKEWLTTATDIQDVTSMSFARQYLPVNSPMQPTHLYVFSDASLQAYGAVAFISTNNQVSFVMAKCRVAPLRQLSLPKLELMGALIAERISNFIREALSPMHLTLNLWTDSQIVLYWLQSSKKLDTFVSHRVREIHQLTGDIKWHFCPTSDNPAVTRGISSLQLKSSNLWKHGPIWLTSPSDWPTWQASQTLHLQALAVTVQEFTPSEEHQPTSTVGLHKIMNIADYSTLHKLTAVTAYILRFVQHLKGHHQTGPLTAGELQQAKQLWIKDCQHQVFRKEISNLRRNSTASKRLVLVRQLRLFLDKNNCLRYGGRIHNAPLSQLSKFPYLLPAKHDLTTLIIRSTHLRLLHSGTNSTLTALIKTRGMDTHSKTANMVCYPQMHYMQEIHRQVLPNPRPSSLARD